MQKVKNEMKKKYQILLMKRAHTYHSLRNYSTPNLFSDYEIKFFN